MNAQSWVETNRASFGSEYELMFATSVLPLVHGLAWDTITVQYPFKDKDGKQRYCDFAIIESDDVRLAIEIDGFDKRGTGGMSYGDFLDWQRRQASLASYGWHVLRFANRDVRDNPGRCAEHITDLLEQLRRREGGRVVIVEPLPPQVPVVSTSAQTLQPAKPKTTPVRRVLVMGLGAVAVFMGIAATVQHTRGSNGGVGFTEPERASLPGSGTGRISQNLRYGTLACVNPIDWSQASQHLGRVAIVRGPLVATTKRPDLAGSPMWLDVGQAFPSSTRLNIVVWGKNWAKFEAGMLAEKGLEKPVSGRGAPTVCVRGRINAYKGVPQIELEDPSQVSVF